MDARRVRQVCEARLRTIELPAPFTIDAFCTSLSQERGRPIRLAPLPDGNGSPCGLWVATAEVDWVFHQVHARRQVTPDAETTFGRAVDVFGPDT